MKSRSDIDPTQGEQGILAVRESLCTVDAETASAWCLEDERHVKRVIEQSIGFEKVNEKVQERTIFNGFQWFSSVF